MGLPSVTLETAEGGGKSPNWTYLVVARSYGSLVSRLLGWRRAYQQD